MESRRPQLARRGRCRAKPRSPSSDNQENVIIALHQLAKRIKVDEPAGRKNILVDQNTTESDPSENAVADQQPTEQPEDKPETGEVDLHTATAPSTSRLRSSSVCSSSSRLSLSDDEFGSEFDFLIADSSDESDSGEQFDACEVVTEEKPNEVKVCSRLINPQQKGKSAEDSVLVNIYNNVVLSNIPVVAPATKKVHLAQTETDFKILRDQQLYELGEYTGDERNIPYFFPSKDTKDPKNPILKMRFKVRTEDGLSEYRVNSKIDAEPDVMDIDLPTFADEKKRPRMDSDDEYEPERILISLKDTTDGRMKYYTKWAEWPMDQCTWETSDSFKIKKVVGHSDLHQQYQQRQRVCSEIAKRYGYTVPDRTVASFKQKSLRKLMLFERQIDVLCNEFSQGKLYVENWIDEDVPKVKFTLENSFSLSASRELYFLDDSNACRCGTTCSPKTRCCPIVNGEPFLFTNQHGISKKHIKSGRSYMHYECSVGCDCSQDCTNRLVQNGRQIPLVLFNTNDRGWGVFAAQPIPAGTFVTEYIGHIITMKEAQDTGCTTYSFDLDGYGDEFTKFTIDAERRGNEARFVNHSCEPNLKAIPVMVDFNALEYHRIAYFAIRDIKLGEELSIDYFSDGMKAKGKDKEKGKKVNKRNADITKECKCNAAKCRKILGWL